MCHDAIILANAVYINANVCVNVYLKSGSNNFDKILYPTVLECEGLDHMVEKI